MKHIISLLVLLLPNAVSSQSDLIEKHFNKVDSTYREDQFYIGLGINFLLNRPEGMAQSGFSGGVHFGFIRDMPINRQRNISIGVGLGLSLNTYSQNLFIGEEVNGQTIFEILTNDIDYTTNRFSTYIAELPVQFRWRTSSIGDQSSFWRIYSGFNIGYIYYFSSRFEQPQNQVNQNDIEDLNRTRLSFYFAFGKSKINFFFKYSLNPLFDGNLNNSLEAVRINEIKAGLVFYIL
jgi:hypothetical protein